MGPLKENPTGYDEFYALWAFLSHSIKHPKGLIIYKHLFFCMNAHDCISYQNMRWDRPNFAAGIKIYIFVGEKCVRSSDDSSPADDTLFLLAAAADEEPQRKKETGSNDSHLGGMLT